MLTFYYLVSKILPTNITTKLIRKTFENWNFQAYQGGYEYFKFLILAAKLNFNY